MFHKRLTKYSNLGILQERGIELEELMDIVVPMVMRQRSWGLFVQQPICTSLKVVSEFYATMVPEVFENGGAVYVRGRQVHMSVKAITDYIWLDTDFDHVDWEALNPKCIAYGDALAQDLGPIGQPTQTSSGIVIFREQLNLDSAFWNAFSYYYVLPSEEGGNFE
ncbi:hypothetical protein ACOSQ2_020619 [Xanthoceras sorbifolium]